MSFSPDIYSNYFSLNGVTEFGLAANKTIAPSNDDSFRLTKALYDYTQSGRLHANGATVYLYSPNGFYFASTVLVPSGITLDFLGSNIVLGAAGNILSMGNPHRSTGAITLASDATAGDTVLNIPNGAVTANSLAADDVVQIIAKLDGSGAPLPNQMHLARLTAVDATANPDTITLNLGIPDNYTTFYAGGAYQTNWGTQNVTQIFKLAAKKLSADCLRHKLIVQFASTPPVTTGDYALFRDDALSPSGNPYHIDIVKVVSDPSNDTSLSSNQVRLERGIAHDFTTSNNAWCCKLDLTNEPAVRNFSIDLGEVQTSTGYHFIRGQFTKGMRISNGVFKNTLPYTNKSTCARYEYSSKWIFEGCRGEGSWNLGAADGYFFSAYASADGIARDNIINGFRHSILGFWGASYNTVISNTLLDVVTSGIDLHGCEENNWFIANNHIKGASDRVNAFPSGSTFNHVGIKTSNTSHQQGPKGTTIVHNLIEGFNPLGNQYLDHPSGADTNPAVDGIGIEIVAGSEDTLVAFNTIRLCEYGVRAFRNSSATSLETTNTIIEHNIFEKINKQSVNIDGNSTLIINGAIVRYNTSIGSGAGLTSGLAHFTIEQNKVGSTVISEGNTVINPTVVDGTYAFRWSAVDNGKSFNDKAIGTARGWNLLSNTTGLLIHEPVAIALADSSSKFIINDDGSTANLRVINPNFSEAGALAVMGGTASSGRVIHGKGFNNIPVVVTQAYTATFADDEIRVSTASNANFNVTLFASSNLTKGKVLSFKDAGGLAGTNNVIIDPGANKTIDGAATLTINSNYAKYKIRSIGPTGWETI